MKKLVAETLNEFVDTTKELFKGQKDVGLKASDFDPKELLVGIAVEIEHSSNLAVRETIAKQHLADNAKYYSEGMKKGLFDEPAAINLYKKYFIDKEEPEEETKEPEKEPEKGPDLGGMNLGL
jgi:hypothetical protein